MTHIMIDLETLSTRADAAILQIAAVSFTPFNSIPIDQFSVGIDTASSIIAGGHVKPETVSFWRDQGHQPWRLYGNLKEELFALQEFTEWVERQCHEGQSPWLWAKGPDFDITILKSAFDRHEMTFPWSHSKARDVRTALHMAEVLGRDPQTPRPASHDALDDCKQQIEQVTDAFKWIREAIDV